jgi:hypothetical protein
MVDFEGDHQDILQNIEFAIVSVYRRHPELADYEVEKALDVLISVYQAEIQHQTADAGRMNPLTQDVFDSVKTMCGWRLGREAMVSMDDQSQSMIPDPVSVDLIIASLKRIRKSVQKWNKRGGRQGYLQFIEQYIV